MSIPKADKEALWEQNVEEARRIVASKTKNQIEIAKLALEVCEVEHGGDRRAKDVRFTLENFAKDAGINPKTLYQWCLLKRNVYDKLTEQNRHRVQFSHLTYLNRRVNSSTDARDVNEAVDVILSDIGIDRIVLRYISDMLSLKSHLHKPNFSALIDKKTAEELAWVLEETVTLFKGHYPKIRAYNHSNAAKYSNRRSKEPTLVGNMKTDNGVWVNVSEKDEMIYRHLLKMSASGFVSPSVLGDAVSRKLGRNLKKSSPFACRSLQRLGELGLAERNNVGHWRAIRKDFTA